MNTNNHNPGIVPGYYNPGQSKTEALDYQNFLGTEFVDPTQIPMIPGDTQRPMQTPQNIREQIIENRVMQPIDASTENYQREMQLLYTKREEETVRASHNKTIEAIRIPIVIELTINLNINNTNYGNI